MLTIQKYMHNLKTSFAAPLYILYALVFLTHTPLVAAPLTVSANDVTITRGDSASLSCTASGGCPPYTYKWTSWTKGSNTAEKTASSISAKILESCSVTVTVTDSAATSASASKTVAITVQKREWNVVHTTSDDTWSGWGSFPFGVRGDNINANNSTGVPIIGETDNDWDQQITKTQVSDSNGPFDHYWYNSTHTLRVERETRINQYLKGQVSGASFNWVALQDNFAANPGTYSPVIDANAVLDGVKAHENQGNVAANCNSSPKQGGHSALFKKKQDSDPLYNAAKRIESCYNATSKDDLQTENNSQVSFASNAMGNAGMDPLTGNYKTYMIINYDPATQVKTYDLVDR